MPTDTNSVEHVQNQRARLNSSNEDRIQSAYTHSVVEVPCLTEGISLTRCLCFTHCIPSLHPGGRLGRGVLEVCAVSHCCSHARVSLHLLLLPRVIVCRPQRPRMLLCLQQGRSIYTPPPQTTPPYCIYTVRSCVFTISGFALPWHYDWISYAPNYGRQCISRP